MNLFLQIGLIEMWIIYVICTENYDFPRRYVLHTMKATWYESQSICEEDGGHLATLYDYSTVPDLGLQQYFYSNYRRFWTGLYFDNNTDVYTWSGGDSVTWSNWKHVTNEESIYKTAMCVMASVDEPYDWVPVECTKKHYFLCQYTGGECRFVRYQDASITSHDYMHLYQQTAEDCKQTCAVQLSGTCKSFEHYPADGRCQFSAGNRWTLSVYYRSAPGWVYYHRTCNIGSVLNTQTVSIDPTPPCLQTTSIYLTPEVRSVTVTVPQSVIITQQEYYTSNVYVTQLVTTTQTVLETTTQVLYMTPSYPELSESLGNEPMEELQEIGAIAKEKRKTLTKISVEDKRPSARYVGYVAVMFLSVVFGSLVVFDLLTLCRNKPACCLKTTKFKKPRASVFTRKHKTHKATKTKSKEVYRVRTSVDLPSVSNIEQTTTHGDNDAKTDEASSAKHRAQMHWRPIGWPVTDSGIDGSELSNSSYPSETSSWCYNDIDNRDNSETSVEPGTSYDTHL